MSAKSKIVSITVCFFLVSKKCVGRKVWPARAHAGNWMKTVAYVYGLSVARIFPLMVVVSVA